MKKALVSVLLVIVLVLVLLVGGAAGLVWYRDSHVFVEGIAYPAHAASLDLRGQMITLAHYDALRELLPECRIVWDVPFHGEKHPSDSVELTVDRLSREDVDFLTEHFPDLAVLHGESCRDYDQLEAFGAANPRCRVEYTVDIGGTSVSPDTDALVLRSGEYDLAVLERNLPHLPALTSLHFPTPSGALEALQAFRDRQPGLTVTYTVEFLGRECDPVTTTELDLSQLRPEEVEQAAEQLKNLPNVTYIRLAKDGVSTLSKQEARALTLAAPQAAFDYTFDFYGVTLSSADEEVHLKNKNIGDEGEAEIRLALDLLPRCRRFVLEYCNVSYDLLAQIREDYRGRTKVVWRVNFGSVGGSALTDATAIRVVGGLLDSNCHNLIYCEDTVFMDIGHNEWLNGVPFVAGMPNLEYVIISGAPVKSLEPFRVCTKLRFLEAAFCEYIYDAAPLADCVSLEMVNISYSHITDLSPLDDLEHLHTLFVMYEGRSRVPWDEQVRFTQLHPDILTEFVGKQPYGIGWRYATTNTFLPDYQLIRDIFNYDAFPGPGCPNDTGFYYDTQLYENRRNLK